MRKGIPCGKKSSAICRQRASPIFTAMAGITSIWTRHGHVRGSDHSVVRLANAFPPFFVHLLLTPQHGCWSVLTKE